MRNGAIWAKFPAENRQTGSGVFSTPTTEPEAPHRVGLSELEPRVNVQLPVEAQNCDFYFGNDQKVEAGNAEAAAEILLMREFPELFDGKNEKMAARFVPDCFISDFPKHLEYGNFVGGVKKTKKTTIVGNLRGEENER